MAVKHLRTAVRSASAPIHGNSRRIRAVAPRILDAEWSRPCGCRRCNYAWRRTKAFKRFWLSNWQYLTISHKREEVVWDRDQFNNHFASERRLRRAVTPPIGWAYSGRSPGYPVTVWLDHLTAVRGSR